jgi:hypothetical protein
MRERAKMIVKGVTTGGVMSESFDEFVNQFVVILSIPLTLALPRNFPKTFPAPFHQAMVQIQKLAVEVFEFVPLLDEKVQEKFLENFSGGPK